MRYSLVLLLFIFSSLKADILATVTTAQLSTDVIEAAFNNPFGNFMNYQIKGVCIWQHVEDLVPIVTTTVYVSEFLPDAVVSVYQHDDENPWDYGNTILDPLFKQAGQSIVQKTMGNDMTQADQSTDAQGSGTGVDASNKYKDVDIVGDPVVNIISSMFSGNEIPTQASPFALYYSSLLDAYMWRNPELESVLYAYNLVPFVREVAQDPLAPWGNIFPRYGFTSQPNDYKAAAVLALRAADITTQAAQPHTYVQLGNASCGQGCQTWPSHENDWDDVKYQEIYPEAQITASNDFGKDDSLDLTPFNQNQYDEGKGNYVWVMWRHYEGCVQGEGELIGIFK